MAGSSSSAAVTPPLTRYHVFLNFRGEDTRYNIISHIHEELQRKKIVTYIDYNLVRGEEISSALHRAIEESMIYVVVFSKDYASSTWCLDELTKILDCKKRYGRHVIPVFYKVDPTIVRNQSSETYAQAFAKHEDRFKDNIGKVHAWKKALTEAAGLAGWDLPDTRPESTFVAEIVKDILKKLNRSSISNHQGLVGIEDHIARIESLMHLESPDIRIIGIWGMGGIGKTTIAKQIHHKLALQFDSSSHVLNVREKIERHGIEDIRNKYISELLEEDSRFSKERLKQTKVLLVLDDVNDSRQLKDLIGGRGNFGHGSRIILTTRDMQVLKNAEADEIYEVKEMNSQDSLNLFSIHAFHQNYPKENYEELSRKVLHYAKGIPLALEILGSLLFGRTEVEWEDELQKLKNHPDSNILNVLKQSYDGLDEQQKNIFLDIACFYRGYEEIDVAQRLERCGFHAKIGMAVLKDRCLISILKGEIQMHDLIQEMGREIVRQECPDNPGKHSRLWKAEEICRVLEKNKGTDAVQCIFLSPRENNEVKLHSKAFEKMENLRMFHFQSNALWCESKVILPSSLESLPDGLKILRWDGFPQRSLRPNFLPENLVTLEMRGSDLEQLDQEFPKLKRLDLSYSLKLIRIPDLYLSPDIEVISLTGCVRLTEVYSSGFLNKLNSLRLDDCYELRRLTIPSNILSRSSGLIILSDCDKLETFSIPNRTRASDSKGILSRVKGTFDPVLNIDRQGKEKCCLDLSDCKFLKSLSSEFDLSKLKFLKKLLLNGCSNLKSFPEIEDTMENLAELNLDGTAIRALPSSLCNLVALQELNLHRCTKLETIPSSIGNLSKLCNLDLVNCKSLETFPSSIFILKLTELDLTGCSKLRTLPEILEPAQTFAHVKLTGTAIKELPSSFGNLVQLQTLCLKECTDLESLPNSIVNLNLLSELDCSGCAKLTHIPSDIGRLSLLRKLSLRKSGIVNLPESIAHLSSLEILDLSECKMLQCIPRLPPFLKELLAFYCESITRVMSNSVIQIPSNSKEGGIFRFYFTNGQQLDPGAHANIVDEARLRMTEEAYRSVFFCFPGSEVPHWCPFRGKGYSITINTGSLNFCSDDRLIGFALCVVLQLDRSDTEAIYGSSGSREYESDYEHFLDKTDDIEDRDDSFSYCPKYESDYGEHILPNANDIEGRDESDDYFRYCLKYESDYGEHILPNTNDIEGRDELDDSFSYCLKYESDYGKHIHPNTSDIEGRDESDDSFSYCLKHESDYGKHILPNTSDIEGRDESDDSFSYCLKHESDYGEDILLHNNELKVHLCQMKKHQMTKLDQDHTLLWKYNSEFPGMSCKSGMLPRACSFTFKFSRFYHNYFEGPYLSTIKVKECGIYPIYTKEKDDNNAGADNYS